jgi:RNA polymerase sigma-70 factor, ECF subfamily
MDDNTCNSQLVSPTPARSAAAAPFSDLLDQSRAGDRRALGALLQHCRAYLLEIANAELPAELSVRVAPSDLVQETFTDALHAMGHFRGTTEAELRGWLRRSLLNNIADARRGHFGTQKRAADRQVSLHCHGEAGLSALGVADPIASPSSIFQKRESADQLLAAIDRLPAVYRLVIRLRHFEGLSLERVGEHLGRSPDAVRKLWFRGLEKLGKLVETEQRGE